VNAGASFELQHREYILPHRKEGIVVLHERLVELARHAANLGREASSPLAGNQFKDTAEAHLQLARGLGAGTHGDLLGNFGAYRTH